MDVVIDPQRMFAGLLNLNLVTTAAAQKAESRNSGRESLVVTAT
jgi:hypothetical protein